MCTLPEPAISNTFNLALKKKCGTAAQQSTQAQRGIEAAAAPLHQDTIKHSQHGSCSLGAGTQEAGHGLHSSTPLMDITFVPNTGPQVS